MGLLSDILNDPETAMGLGLLNAGGPSRMPVSFGQGLAQGYGAYGEALKAQQARKMAEQEMLVRAQQIEHQKMQVAEAAMKMKDAEALRNFDFGKYYQAPQQQAIGAGGPTPDAAGMIPNLEPRLDTKGMLAGMMASKSPALQKEALAMLTKEDAPVVLTDGGMLVTKSGKTLATNAKDMKPDPIPWYVKKDANGNAMIDPAFADFEKAKAASGRPVTPYFTPVATADGVVAFNNRAGTVAPVTSGGQAVIKSSDNPMLQGKIAGAKTTGEATAKRDMNMSGLGDVINTAEGILTGKAGNLPTGSAIGTGVDKVASVFGMNPTGATEAQQLKALSGVLTSKMPRMEGPQSDKDVQLYREMAADIGNPMMPRARRIAALQTVKQLNAKYAQPSGGVQFLGFE